MEPKYWSSQLDDALSGRVEKPRIGGLTMVIDKGLPMTMMRDLFQLAASHIDYWKFGFGSASVCPPERMMDKVMLCQEYGIEAYSGGTSLEIAYVQNRWRDYLSSLWEAGIKVVEVSDGTVHLPLRTRREIIRTARKMGFTVLSEVGKKIPGTFLPVSEQAQIIHGDLNSGANYIVVEGREAGRGIGVYDAEGNVRTEDVDALLHTVGPLCTRLIWEAPLAKQQVFYINHLGNQVNLGNVSPLDIVTLEATRRGFRSDTLRPTLRDEYLMADVVGQSQGMQTGQQTSGATLALRRRKGSHESGDGITLWTPSD